jgi:hypothetical protein
VASANFLTLDFLEPVLLRLDLKNFKKPIFKI